MKHRQAVVAMLILALVFTAIFSTLLHLRNKTFFSHDWRDEAVDNQIIYNTAHGRIVYSTIKGPMIFHRHFRPIFIVCALPWLIVDKIQTWFFTVGIVLGFGCFGIYAFARRRLRSVPLAFSFAALYLFWQPLHEVALGNYDPETIVATFWLMAAVSFDTERPGWFWFWTLMALICKETMAVVLFGFGVLALLQRRKITWWLPALVVAPVWFLASIKLIIPIYWERFDTIYGRFIGCTNESGDFPICFLGAMLSDPIGTLRQVFSREHLILLAGLLRGVGFLSFLGFEWLIPAIPVALEVILLKDPHPVRQAHILSGMLPFVFLAAIVGLSRLSDWGEKLFAGRIQSRNIIAAGVAILFAVNLIVAFLPGVFGRYQNYGLDPLPGFTPSNVFDSQFYEQTDKERRAWETIALIPETAAAMTNSRFLLALSSRSELKEFGTQVLPEDFDDSPFLLISFTEPPCRTCTFNPLTKANLEMLWQLVEEGRYKVIRAYEDHALLIHRQEDSYQETPGAREILKESIEAAKERARY